MSCCGQCPCASSSAPPSRPASAHGTPTKVRDSVSGPAAGNGCCGKPGACSKTGGKDNCPCFSQAKETYQAQVAAARPVFPVDRAHFRKKILDVVPEHAGHDESTGPRLRIGDRWQTEYRQQFLYAQTCHPDARLCGLPPGPLPCHGGPQQQYVNDPRNCYAHPQQWMQAGAQYPNLPQPPHVGYPVYDPHQFAQFPAPTSHRAPPQYVPMPHGFQPYASAGGECCGQYPTHPSQYPEHFQQGASQQQHPQQNPVVTSEVVREETVHEKKSRPATASSSTAGAKKEPAKKSTTAATTSAAKGPAVSKSSSSTTKTTTTTTKTSKATTKPSAKNTAAPEAAPASAAEQAVHREEDSLSDHTRPEYDYTLTRPPPYMIHPDTKPYVMDLEYNPMRYSEVWQNFTPATHAHQNPHYFKYLPHYYTSLIEPAGVKTKRSWHVDDCLDVFQ